MYKYLRVMANLNRNTNPNPLRVTVLVEDLSLLRLNVTSHYKFEPVTC